GGEIGEAAGGGKAALSRRWAAGAGVGLGWLDAGGRDVRALTRRGPPPLGPGASAEQRLAAFIDALVDLLEAHTDLVVASETAPPGARYRSGLYATYHMHVRLLVAEARGPGADADALAELLLAP